MKKASAFLVSSFLSAFFAVSTLPSNAQDIESLLDQAEALSSPLLPEKLCDADTNFIAASQTAENGVISVTLEQACYIETGEQRFIAVEGVVQNLNASSGLSMTVADKFLQLSLNGNRQPAVANLGSLARPDFFVPLGARDIRNFSLVYQIEAGSTGQIALEHPSQAGIISIDIGLLDGQPRPEAPVSVASEISEPCSAPAEWFSANTGQSSALALNVRMACFIKADENRLYVAGDIKSLLDNRDIALPSATLLFRLETETGVIVADGTELSPSFAGAIQPQESRPFSVAFDLDAETTGPISLQIPLSSNAIVVPIGSIPDVQNLPALSLDLAPLPESPEANPATTEEENAPEPAITVELDPPPVAEPDRPEPETAAPENEMDNAQFALVKGENSALGTLVSRGVDGASISITRGTPNLDPQLLLNGVLAWQDEASVLTADADNKTELMLTMPQNRVALLSHVVIDARTRTSHRPVPAFVRLFASQNGPQGPWEDLGTQPTPTDAQHRLIFRFHAPVEANALRIEMAGVQNRVMISEIEAYEVYDAGRASVLDGIQTNLAAIENGGSIVRFTSQYSDWEAANLLTAEGAWYPGTNEFPQDIVIGFEDFKAAMVNEVYLDWYIEVDDEWAPRVKVLVSTDPGPLGRYTELGLMSANVITENHGRTRIMLAAPTAVRWLKITVSEPGAERYSITQAVVRGDVRGIRSPDQGLEVGEPESTVQNQEVEPNNDASTATVLPRATPVLGRSDADGDVDFYSFEVEGTDPQIVAFSLMGRPWIRTRLALINPTGEIIFTHDPTTAETEHNFTWRLDPGQYQLRLEEPASGIAMVIDDSGSMGDSIFVAKEAARLFALSKRPEERLSLFRFSGPVVELSPLTSDGQALARLIENGIDQSVPGGTSVYDAVIAGMESLADAQGNRAVILLTDGEDVSSQISYPRFWSTLEEQRVPIYAIGLGSAMWNYDKNVSTHLNKMLEAFALGTGGAYFASPTADDLPKVWEDIARRIRDRGGYALSWDIPALGSLAVLETGEEFTATNAMGDILFILDASGSMKAQTDQGRSRINVARSLIYDILDDIPDNARVGLRIYGANLPAQPKEASCDDSVLAVSIAPDSQESVAQTVARVDPRGQTPIGRSLAWVMDDMRGAERGLVVLLTDGEETCDANKGDQFFPEHVAQALFGAGLDVHVNIVGFDVTDPEIQNGLAQIAQASGGTFFPAEGEAGLRTALREAFTAPVTIEDDLGQIIAETKVGNGPIQLPAAHYQVIISGQRDLAPPQTLSENQELRLYINKEGTEIRVSSEIVETGTPLNDDVRVNLRPAVTPEQQAVLDTLLVPELNPRVPSSPEELTYKVQALLTDLGYEPGPADGQMGPATRRAIDAFVADFGTIIEGVPVYDRQGNPDRMLWLQAYSIHVQALLRPILFGDEIRPDIALKLNR